MGRRRRHALPARVDEVRRRIEHWRKTRTKRSPMPGHLWEAATSLARAHGIYPIARACRLHYDSLKDRVGKKPTPRRKAAAPPAEFIDLTSVLPVGVRESGGPVVELSDGNGAKLRVRLAASSELDLSQLTMTFFGRGA